MGGSLEISLRNIPPYFPLSPSYYHPGFLTPMLNVLWLLISVSLPNLLYCSVFQLRIDMLGWIVLYCRGLPCALQDSCVW